MTAALTCWCGFPRALDWHAIDWRKAHRNVRRLQARIVQATQAGRWGKVKALQRLLTHSFSAKALAVRRVTENHGKRTPGVDGETWNTPAQKAQAIQSCGERGYHPHPLRRVYIPKSNGQNAPTRDSNHERPGHAGTVPARPGSGRGDAPPTRTPTGSGGALPGGRHRAVLHSCSAIATVRQWVLRGRHPYRASTGSAMTGFWPTCRWTETIYANG